MPDFKCEEPFFANWSTPMVESGIIWIAIDRTTEQERWDRLFIDSNANGHLDDETAITAYQTERYYTYFGPVKVVFEGEDGPLTYHLIYVSANGLAVALVDLEEQAPVSALRRCAAGCSALQELAAGVRAMHRRSS